MQGRPDTVHYS